MAKKKTVTKKKSTAKKKSTKKMGTFRQRAAKRKSQIEKRHKESQERKDEGFSSSTILLRDQFPAGLEEWQPEVGEHIIDVVPFYAGVNHTRDPQGDWSYVVDLWVHRNIGPSNQHFPCMQRNYEKRCAVCDYIKAHDLSKNEFNRMKAKRRCVYLVWVHDEERKEEKKGILVWEVAHFFFEKKVDGIARRPRGGGIVLWADHDRGKSVAFRIKKEGQFETDDGKKIDSYQYTDFSLLDREENIPDHILDHGVALDELIDMKPKYGLVKKAVYASDEEDIDEEPESEEYDDAGDAEVDEDDGAVEEGEDEDLAEETEEEEEVEEEDEGPDLESMSRRDLLVYIRDNELDVKAFKKDSDDDIREKIIEALGSEEEQEGEEIEEEEGDEECPAEGGTFGKDADTFEECLECDVYDKCAELSGV